MYVDANAHWGIPPFQVLSGKVPYHYIKQPIQIVLLVVDGKMPRPPEDPKIADNHWNMIQSCWGLPNDRPFSQDILTFVTTQRSKHKIGWSNTRYRLNIHRSSIVTCVSFVGLQNTCEQRSILSFYCSSCRRLDRTSFQTPIPSTSLPPTT